MSEWKLKTPVVFIIFNRPETTEKVFERIREAKPPKLLVVADGPRKNVPGEAEKCEAARTIIKRADWDCEVLKDYSDVNLGCGRRLASGITWAFEQVEEAIILEDDCLPHSMFFRFCEELLNRYRNDERIMSITGQNVQKGHKRTEYSYYFSRYSHCWGWASWRCAWKYYDFKMKLWPEIQGGNFLRNIFQDPKALKNWERVFQNVYEGQIDTWDYQWTFACWIQNGLAIIPEVNLVSNIGFGEESTHTREKSDFSNVSTHAIAFPLVHPPFVMRHFAADSFTQNTLYNYLDSSVSNRMKNKIKNLIWK